MVPFPADHFGRLADADWIIEAIIEQLEPKRDLMARIDEVRKPGSVVSTNTSGIPVSTIAAATSLASRPSGAAAVASTPKAPQG